MSELAIMDDPADIIKDVIDDILTNFTNQIASTRSSRVSEVKGRIILSPEAVKQLFGYIPDGVKKQFGRTSGDKGIRYRQINQDLQAEKMRISMAVSDLQNFVDCLERPEQETVKDDQGELGEVCRRERIDFSKLEGALDEASKQLFALRDKIELQNRIVNQAKARLYAFMSEQEVRKGPKTCDDKIQMDELKTKVETELEKLTNLAKTFMEEVRKLKLVRLTPIQLSTTIQEDFMHKALVRSTSYRDYKKIFSPSILEGLELKPSELVTDEDNRMNEVEEKDRLIETLQKQIRVLSCELLGITRDKYLSKEPEVPHCDAEIGPRMKIYRKNAENLEENLKKMDCALNCLRAELGMGGKMCLKRPTRRGSISLEEENEDLKKQYALLLQEFGRKETELRSLMETLAQTEGCDLQSAEKTALSVLQKQVKELLEGKEEMQILIREQSRQLDEYREKFLRAQQTVEEQRHEIDRLILNEERIEDQINMEIARIKSKFQAHMRELLPLPKLNEALQLQIASLTKQHETMISDLQASEKMINELEAEIEEFNSRNPPSDPQRIEKLLEERDNLQRQIDDLRLDKSRMQEILACEHDKFVALREETAKIIARTNERAEGSRLVLQQHLNRLENDLAKARAKAKVDLDEREHTVRRARCQMKTLSASLEDAKEQISNLKRQLATLSGCRRK